LLKRLVTVLHNQYRCRAYARVLRHGHGSLDHTGRRAGHSENQDQGATAAKLFDVPQHRLEIELAMTNLPGSRCDWACGITSSGEVGHADICTRARGAAGNYVRGGPLI
jgi:hypothetical protein